MNKFESLIGTNGNEVLKRRATNIAINAEIAQQTIVNTLKQRKSELEMKIMNLTDLAPEDTTSLRPGSKDWDAAKWALDLQNAKVALYTTSIELKIAEDTYEEYFKVQPES